MLVSFSSSWSVELAKRPRVLLEAARDVGTDADEDDVADTRRETSGVDGLEFEFLGRMFSEAIGGDNESTVAGELTRKYRQKTRFVK